MPKGYPKAHPFAGDELYERLLETVTPRIGGSLLREIDAVSSHVDSLFGSRYKNQLRHDLMIRIKTNYLNLNEEKRARRKERKARATTSKRTTRKSKIETDLETLGVSLN